MVRKRESDSLASFPDLTRHVESFYHEPTVDNWFRLGQKFRQANHPQADIFTDKDQLAEHLSPFIAGGQNVPAAHDIADRILHRQDDEVFHFLQPEVRGHHGNTAQRAHPVARLLDRLTQYHPQGRFPQNSGQEGG